MLHSYPLGTCRFLRLLNIAHDMSFDPRGARLKISQLHKISIANAKELLSDWISQKNGLVKSSMTNYATFTRKIVIDASKQVVTRNFQKARKNKKQHQFDNRSESLEYSSSPRKQRYQRTERKQYFRSLIESAVHKLSVDRQHDLLVDCERVSIESNW